MPEEKKTWWLIQQGTTYSLTESAGYPNLDVPTGQRRKVVKGNFQTKEAGEVKGKEMASHFHGTWKA